LLIATGGLLWLSQLPSTNHYYTAVLPGLVITTFGLGLSMVPMTIAATAGVAPREAGLAAGLVNTSRQIGGAIGLAALATAAASRTNAALADHATAAHALTDGYNRASLITAAVALVGVFAALTLPKLVRPPVAPGTPAGGTADAVETEILIESELETEAGAISDSLPIAEGSQR